MIRIVLVGDIGSGKTHISKLFQTPYFSADKEVKKIYKRSRKCFIFLRKKFPNFIKTFPIKKKELTSVIKNNIFDLKKIGIVVHPFVRKRLKKFLEKNKNEKIVLLDIPLYLENKMYQKGDVIIFLKTKRKDVVKRLKKRKNFNKNMLRVLRKFQLTLKQKQEKSNYILVNNYNSANIKNKIKILKDKILNDRSSS
tara:strand:+ start:123 stop:710 length:588 start_codon:yes stop_codon:yes gene_type:complete